MPKRSCMLKPKCLSSLYYFIFRAIYLASTFKLPFACIWRDISRMCNCSQLLIYPLLLCHSMSSIPFLRNEYFLGNRNERQNNMTTAQTVCNLYYSFNLSISLGYCKLAAKIVVCNISHNKYLFWIYITCE